jgi:PleD family two-component response regulator
MSISGGVAEYPHDGLDAPGLLAAADAALYKAKGQGRNRILAAMRQPVAPTAGTAGEAARP